jgi:hypothetical protein
LLGEHGEEDRQKITELKALCKKLRKEKTKLEGMVESCDELIMDSATSMDTTAMMTMMTMTMTEETPPHPLLLRHPLSLRRLLLPPR